MLQIYQLNYLCGISSPILSLACPDLSEIFGNWHVSYTQQELQNANVSPQGLAHHIILVTKTI